MPSHIIHAEEMQEIVESFVSESRSLLESLDVSLTELRQAPNDTSLLDDAFRAVHTIKGNAGFLELDQVETLAHHLEGLLSRLHGQSRFISPALLDTVRDAAAVLKTLVRQVADRRIRPVDLSDLVERLRSVAEALPDAGRRSLSRRSEPSPAEDETPPVSGEAPAVPLLQIFRAFRQLTLRLAQRLDKQVEVVLWAEDVALSPAFADTFRSLLGHLIRNAVDHGIEAPETRRQRGKPEQGRVALYSRHTEEGLVIQIEDDGVGIDADSIKEKAIQNRLVTADHANQMSTSETLQLAFQGGLSTRDVVTRLSGRGVGLDVVRTSLDAVGGTVAVESAPGKGTCVTITMPSALVERAEPAVGTVP